MLKVLLWCSKFQSFCCRFQTIIVQRGRVSYLHIIADLRGMNIKAKRSGETENMRAGKTVETIIHCLSATNCLAARGTRTHAMAAQFESASSSNCSFLLPFRRLWTIPASLLALTWPRCNWHWCCLRERPFCPYFRLFWALHWAELQRASKFEPQVLLCRR